MPDDTPENEQEQVACNTFIVKQISLAPQAQ